ncbi:MAG: tetratricopeptide repeat protein [Saprospiraceae bacterium]
MRLLLVTAFSILYTVAWGQDKSADVDWTFRIDSLLEIEDLKYQDLVPVLYEIRYDSTLMTYLLGEAQVLNKKVAQSFAKNLLGTMHRRRYRYDFALRAHEEAHILAIKAKDTLGEIISLNSRGIVFRYTDRVTDALDAHQAAIELAKASKTDNSEYLRALAIAYDGKGRIHLKIEQFDQAEKAFYNSMEFERKIGSTLGLAINHFNLGTALELRGRLDSALIMYRKALVYNAEIDSEIGFSINTIGIARVLTRQGSYYKALKLIREALPIVEKRKHNFYMTTAELAYGDILIETNNFPVAKTHLLRAQALSIEHNLIDEEAKALRLLSKLEERQDHIEEAFAYFKRANELEKRVLNEKNQRYVSALSAQYDDELKDLEIKRLAQENELVRERSRRTRRNFTGFVILLLFLGVILGVLYRQRKLVLQRDLVKLEQQRLAAQMNPHFLFNALNSVKSYLISNQGDAAINYLSKFAKLMRRILSSTNNEQVPLAEEIENSKLYVSIENARFNELIDFRVNVAPNVDGDFLTIPPMVLQPFLENALWHGLRQKEGEKILELEVTVNENEALQLIVRDNGIGRAATQLEKQHNPTKQKSFGLDITRKRLQHFAKKQGRAADFEVKDLTLADGSAGGTEVIIWVG